jgi:hypothetical protein
MRKTALLAALFFIAIQMPTAQEASQPALNNKGPAEGARNMQRIGAAVGSDGKIDLGPYSKLAPWPETDGRYLYSGCYDPAPLVKNIPEADRCFMTVDLKDPEKPVRLATVYSFDPVQSPAPPPNHIVWSPKYPFPNLPAKAPCKVDWNDPEIAAGKKAPPCWDPGWNTHTHYVQEASGKILAVNQERYRSGTSRQANYHGVKFYDVSDPAKPVFLSYWEAPSSPPDPATGIWPDANGVHHFNFQDGYLYIGSEYKGFVGKILVILDVKEPRNPKEAGKWWIPGQKTPEEDAVRDWVQVANFNLPVAKEQNGKWTKHVGMHYVTVSGDSAYLAYHQAGLVILDVKDKSRPNLKSRVDYLIPGADPTNPDISACRKAAGGTDAACGNTHAAKPVPNRPLLVVSDEYFTCPYGHVRIFDVSDESRPKILSHFLTDQNTACDPAQPNKPADPARFPRRGPSSHLGNALGNLYFMAWYGMGVRVIEIADPVHPVETGFYEYRIDRDLNEGDPAYSGSDTYDVVFGPKGYLYVSDGTAGLRVLKYTGGKEGGP